MVRQTFTSLTSFKGMAKTFRSRTAMSASLPAFRVGDVDPPAHGLAHHGHPDGERVFLLASSGGDGLPLQTRNSGDDSELFKKLYIVLNRYIR